MANSNGTRAGQGPNRVSLPHRLSAEHPPTRPQLSVPSSTSARLCFALAIRYLSGNAWHSPAFGFQTGGGPPTAGELPGIAVAASTTLGLGAVLGPEAPLIAIGGGLAALAVRLAKKDAPPKALTIMASAGSFAAISSLLGSPGAVLGAERSA